MTEAEFKELKSEFDKNKRSIEVPLDKIIEQIKIFEKGIPYLKLLRPCTISDGIKVIDEKMEYKGLVSLFSDAVEEGRVSKFVPASGAASRMFKSIQVVLAKHDEITRSILEEGAGKNDKDCISVLKFIDNIEKFAFFDELKETMTDNGLDFDESYQKKVYTQIIKSILDEEGLNYLNQPKGSILFHKYPNEARTAFEEHLIETINYTKINDSPVKIHFTIVPEHRGLVNSIIGHAIAHKTLGSEINVSYSYQKSATDTIAVTIDNKPFKDDDGNLVFRPAGHGALLENLNDLLGDIVFIKNIDNIVPDHLRNTTILYKKLLGGYLIKLQNKLFTYLRALESEDISPSTLNSIKKFASDELLIDFTEDFKSLSTSLAINVLKDKLNRPIRVCGMVKNEGEPGGGPFWVEEGDGLASLQIVEKTQIDLNNPGQIEILNASIHFNPVDLVCGLRDYRGLQFDLHKFSDPDRGLIVTKSKDGRDLKALELPGLWNGSMAGWITIFVEVPSITFNPVKEINDLLREEHQPPEPENNT